ncbi:MAG: spermidine/putrescine ABC transporter substrate-binding protein, partial [Anaerolineales bacterium]|nr:spermidine/putrescine ABC transporter substrate-binding protein [Anaerolineales bacterium]
VPNFRNIGYEFKNPSFDPGNRYSVPYQWGTSCLAVDTARVTREITSWADLWDPAFQGKVMLLDDDREVLSMVLSVLGYDPNSTVPAELEAAKIKLQELMPNVGLIDSDSPKTALLAGQVWLGMTWSGEATLAHQENPAIEYIFPEEGCSIWFDNLVILKNAPNQDAALAFINYVLSAEASILITQEFPYSTPNTAALDLLKKVEPDFYASYLGFAATNPPSEDMARLRLLTDLGEDGDLLWDRVWAEAMENE